MKDKFVHQVGKSLLRQAAEWKKSATRAQKAAVSESLGESFAEKVSSQQHQMKAKLTGADKGTNHYFDAAYVDKEGRFIAVEAKGQGSKLSALQKNANWLTERSRMVMNGEKGYGKASPQEKAIARQVFERLERGEPVYMLESRTRMSGSRVTTTVKTLHAVVPETRTQAGPLTTKSLDNLAEATRVSGKRSGVAPPAKPGTKSSAGAGRAAAKVGAKGTLGGKSAMPASATPGSLIGRFLRGGGKL